MPKAKGLKEMERLSIRLMYMGNQFLADLQFCFDKVCADGHTGEGPCDSAARTTCLDPSVLAYVVLDVKMNVAVSEQEWALECPIEMTLLSLLFEVFLAPRPKVAFTSVCFDIVVMKLERLMK